MAIHVVMKQGSNVGSIEVEIRYNELNDEVRKLEHSIRAFDSYLIGDSDERQFKIRIGDIYYFESVDKKTFIYTKNEVFRTKSSLYEIYSKVNQRDFIRVSRSCIVNIDVLDYVKNIANSRLEATLINGEKIMISRTYLKDIRNAFLGGVE